VENLPMPKDPSVANGDGTSAFESMISGDAPDQPLGGGDVAVPDEPDRLAVATQWTETPEFEANEVGFPKLRLAQGLTAEVAEGQAKMGNWLLTGTEPFTEGVTVIPIMFGRTRWKRKNPEDRDSPISCQSGDARTGIGDPGGDCKACPFAKWTPGGANGKNKPPACTLTYKYAVWVDGAEAIAEVTFQKTSETYAHLINNLVQRYGFGKFAVKLTSVNRAVGQRRWSEPQVTLTRLTPAMLEAAGSLIPGNEQAYGSGDWGVPDDAADIVDAEAIPV
jgi:hypothetical protein